jgi:CheY-like chemotaxis protein
VPPQRHLLCIDDNPVNGLLLQEFFQLHSGLPVRLAGSGAEGLAMLRAARPLALLLDLVLPDMSGLAVLEQLRADPLTATLPVAIVSGSVNPEDLVQARRLGAQAHWPKPLDLSQLGRRLDDLLAGAG